MKDRKTDREGERRHVMTKINDTKKW